MARFKSLKEYTNTFNEAATATYWDILDIIKDINLPIQERLFAGQVAFFVESHLNHSFHSSPVIVMAFYHDHVNIFANANKVYKSVLTEYRFTSKDTMQIYYNIPLNKEVLSQLFKESLQ